MFNRLMISAVLGCSVLGASVLLADADVPTTGPDAAQDKSAAVPNELFPKEWFWARTDANWDKINSIVGKKAPDLVVGDWHNPGENTSVKIEDYAGKPLVIDFWGTWCGPCLASAPKISAYAEKYEDKVNIIAVCNTNRGETMAQTADKAGMKIPTAMDQADKSRDAYGVQWWPYYVIIDSKGVVRAAGISSTNIEDAIKRIIEIEAGETDETSTDASTTSN